MRGQDPYAYQTRVIEDFNNLGRSSGLEAQAVEAARRPRPRAAVHLAVGPAFQRDQNYLSRTPGLVSVESIQQDARLTSEHRQDNRRHGLFEKTSCCER
jgi:hypothetical protein